MGPQSFSDYGIISTYELEEFSHSIDKYIGKKAQYDLNLKEKDWDYICSQFINEIKLKIGEK